MMPGGDPAAPKIGPGRLIVVVGRSGAGKDTLLRLAREQLRQRDDIVFPRRIVTREPSAAEDNEYLSDAAFAAGLQAGGFAFWWRAHGLKYALPVAVDDQIRAGRTTVCNVSRAIVADLRHRYANVAVVLVTAPPELLAARLATRGRGSDGDINERLGSAAPPPADISPDAVVENVGDPERGAMKLVALIERKPDP